ncbi:hypothetical protein HDU84_005716 [Entophlyctis sp. JEL0112]|nr:hypothetical protein HDU84_005716 [Entophlyctis sp. JEL0112]
MSSFLALSLGPSQQQQQQQQHSSASAAPSTYAHGYGSLVPFSTASIDPSVYFAILSHSLRRPDELARVMGALLGTVIDDGGGDVEVDVRSCFPLSITENDEEVSVDSEHLTQMLHLHLQANPKETIVGWYSTGDKVDANSALIHEYFASEFPIVPLHLLVDAELKDGRMAVKAFVTSEAGVPSSEFAGTMFLPVPCSVKMNDAERSALDLISSADGLFNLPSDAPVPENGASITGVLSDMDSWSKAIMAIQGMVENLQDWVAGVKSGDIPANDAIGRYLLDTVMSVPLISSSDFDKMFNNHMQDLLMVVYLSNLTRTQLAIAQRLQNLV